MGADEYACDDIYNDVDWNSDRIVDIDDLIVLAAAWLSDPCDPCDENWNPDYDIQPENGDGDIDYGDFAVFGAEWLWEPCWTTSGPSAPMMMGMSGGMYGMMGMGGGESMLMAEQQAESQESYSEPTIEEQIDQLQKCLDFVEKLWQEDEDVREVIDEEDWENFVASIEELLEDLEE